LIEQFFDIILKFNETFLDEYGAEYFKIAGFDVIFCDVMDIVIA